MHGEKYTGVTLHSIERGIDTGKIVDQYRIEIAYKDTGMDLYRKYIKWGAELVKNNLQKLLEERAELTPQSTENSTYYSKRAIDYSNLKLDINQTGYQIQNQIRAFCFRPYQILSWNGTNYVECEILKDASQDRPGVVLEDNSVCTIVSSIDYDVKLYKDTFATAAALIAEGKDSRELCVSKKILEAQESHGWSLLTIAVYNNNFEMVKWLVEAGADTGVVNNNGTTLLMYAKDNFKNSGDKRIFEYLLERGLNPFQKDYKENTLIDYCNEEGISFVYEQGHIKLLVRERTI